MLVLIPAFSPEEKEEPSASLEIFADPVAVTGNCPSKDQETVNEREDF
jgi:hypothetical protein